ncbi:MAG TPA: acetate uptake transporter [Ktedonobacterales bacterium]
MAGATIGPSGTNLERERNLNVPRTNGIEEHWTMAGTVRGPLARQDTEVLAERSQATVADPIPLGLAGFASATFTISSVFAGWFLFSPGDLSVAIPVALVFGGIAQFLAGMWAFRRGNVLAATAFSTFGSFNVSFAILLWLQLVHLVPSIAQGGNPSYVAGIYILTFSLIALYLGIAALGENLGIAAILFTLALTYGFDGVATMASPGIHWIGIVGGYCGLVSSSLAFLVSAAIVINSAMGREIIPMLAVRRTQETAP